MTTIHVDPAICHPNKFQPPTRREFTPDQLADLASIGEIGFIHTPIGFKENGTYMIIVGWRRRCAWMIYHPGELMPLELRDKPATDADLYRLTVVENESRENFNAIQRADLAAQAIELGMTQVQAGKLFNPPLGQSAISHLLSLRNLPDEIKVHIASGAIPERIARQLVTPARHMVALTVKAADKIAKASENEKDRVSRIVLDDLYRSACKSLEYATPWVDAHWKNGRTVLKNLNWPETPIPVPDAKLDKGEPSEIPACTDCPFNVIYEKRIYCMRPACHAVKTRVWNDLQKTKQAAKAAKPAVARGSARGMDKWERERKERQKRVAQHNKESRVLIQTATPAFASILPAQPMILDLMFALVRTELGVPLYKAQAKWKATDAAGKQAIIAQVLITKKVGLDAWTDTPPAKTKKVITDLAKSLKVKLPRNWADPATSAAKSKKRPAK